MKSNGRLQQKAEDGHSPYKKNTSILRSGMKLKTQKDVTQTKRHLLKDRRNEKTIRQTGHQGGSNRSSEKSRGLIQNRKRGNKRQKHKTLVYGAGGVEAGKVI